MLCPNCKTELVLLICNNPEKKFILNYQCTKCSISFERHIFTNEFGLVQMDKLFEMNSNGMILREWK